MLATDNLKHHFLFVVQGLKANLIRLYGNISESQFQRCKAQDKYRRLLFCLCFFHSVLLERRKFLMLGWNIAYEFNDSDFEVSSLASSSMHVLDLVHDTVAIVEHRGFSAASYMSSFSQ